MRPFLRRYEKNASSVCSLSGSEFCLRESDVPAWMDRAGGTRTGLPAGDLSDPYGAGIFVGNHAQKTCD